MTICITKNDIPDYLKDSFLFESIESNDLFEISLDYFDKEFIIKTLDDLIKYIRILDFWMIKRIPIEIYKYVFNNKKDINIEKINEIFNNNYIIIGIQIIIDHVYKFKFGSKNIYLKFGSEFNQQLDCSILPNSITHITFGENFNQSLHTILPNSITHLIFDYYSNFNQPLPVNLPEYITHIIFGECSKFNQPLLYKLPKSISHLTFGRNFNQPINNKLPESITHLTFGYYFNQSFENNLPKSITHLTLYRSSTKKLENLPKTITYLAEILIQK